MKKLASLILICFVLFSCAACGPYSDYAGTYTKSSDSATYTVTLSASGEFKFERKFKTKDPYNPFDKDENNIRKGTFTVNGDKIEIQFSYYDDALRQTVTATAKAKLSGKKLTIYDCQEINGTFVKK